MPAVLNSVLSTINAVKSYNTRYNSSTYYFNALPLKGHVHNTAKQNISALLRDFTFHTPSVLYAVSVYLSNLQ